MVLTNYPNLKLVLILIALIISFIIIIIPITTISNLTIKSKKSKPMSTGVKVFDYFYSLNQNV
jgi:hypothetical protein